MRVPGLWHSLCILGLAERTPDLEGGPAMSQAAVERTLGKLITDECFRDRFFKDPAAATFCAGLELTCGELNALSRVPKKELRKFSASLDDRICRLPLEEGQRPASTHADNTEDAKNEPQAQCR